MDPIMIDEKIKNRTVSCKSDGRLYGRITINGARKCFYGKTIAEVKSKARAYLDPEYGCYKSNITLNAYIEHWFKKYKWNKVEPSTYTRLYSVYNCQIKDTIGKKKIWLLSTDDIQELIDERANPTTAGVEPLAMSGLKRIMDLLRPCLRMAVKERVILSNPCDNVILPVESCIKKKRRRQRTLSDTELDLFKRSELERNRHGEYRNRYGLIYLLMLNLGLRVGEMQALKWSDIDYEKQVVYIKRTMQNNIRNFSEEGTQLYSVEKDATKTEAGCRVLKLNETVLYYLNEVKEFQERQNIVSEYIACSSVGTVAGERNLQRDLDKIVKRSKIAQHISLHTLRHTFGSTMIRKGIGIEVVSKLMGHANINITYAKYIHVLQEQQAMAMDMVTIC